MTQEAIAIIGAGNVGSCARTRSRGGGLRRSVWRQGPCEGGGEGHPRRCRSRTPVAGAHVVLLTFRPTRPSMRRVGLDRSAARSSSIARTRCVGAGGPVWNPPPAGSVTAALAAALPGVAVVKGFNYFGAEDSLPIPAWPAAGRRVLSRETTPPRRSGEWWLPSALASRVRCRPAAQCAVLGEPGRSVDSARVDWRRTEFCVPGRRPEEDLISELDARPGVAARLARASRLGPRDSNPRRRNRRFRTRLAHSPRSNHPHIVLESTKWLPAHESSRYAPAGSRLPQKPGNSSFMRWSIAACRALSRRGVTSTQPVQLPAEFTPLTKPPRCPVIQQR